MHIHIHASKRTYLNLINIHRYSRAHIYVPSTFFLSRLAAFKCSNICTFDIFRYFRSDLNDTLYQYRLFLHTIGLYFFPFFYYWVFFIFLLFVPLCMAAFRFSTSIHFGYLERFSNFSALVYLYTSQFDWLVNKNNHDELRNLRNANSPFEK